MQGCQQYKIELPLSATQVQPVGAEDAVLLQYLIDQYQGLLRLGDVGHSNCQPCVLGLLQQG